MNPQSSTLKFDESGEPLLVRQARQIRAVFAGSSAAEPARLIADHRQDQAIAEADTPLLTIPDQQGADCNAPVIKAVPAQIAPGARLAQSGAALCNSSGNRHPAPPICPAPPPVAE